MAEVHRLRVSVKSDSGTDRSGSDSDSESDRDVREAEPMEVEEGELEPEDISVNRSLKELLPVSLQTKAFSDPVFLRRDHGERPNMSTLGSGCELTIHHARLFVVFLA